MSSCLCSFWFSFPQKLFACFAACLQCLLVKILASNFAYCSHRQTVILLLFALSICTFVCGSYIFFVFYSIPDQYQYKTQEICDIVVPLYSSLIIYFPDQYISQSMCDEAVDDSLAALELIPDWFVKSKIIKKLTFLLSNAPNFVPKHIDMSKHVDI